MTHTRFEQTPHLFWQEIEAEGTHELFPAGGHRTFFPATLPDGQQLALPIRELSDGVSALASLIINQASFAVADHLASALADLARPFAPEIVVGLPTLGLTLAAPTARALGHRRYVPFSTSRKFWYRDDLSVPLRSITSPDQSKRLYADPRMLPLLKGRRVMLVDDVLSSGASIRAGLNLLKLCEVEPVVIGAAMLQTLRWRDALEEQGSGLAERVIGVFRTPKLVRQEGGGWQAETD